MVEIKAKALLEVIHRLAKAPGRGQGRKAIRSARACCVEFERLGRGPHEASYDGLGMGEFTFRTIGKGGIRCTLTVDNEGDVLAVRSTPGEEPAHISGEAEDVLVDAVAMLLGVASQGQGGREETPMLGGS